MHLPKYPVPKDGDAGDYLRQLCLVGLKKRFKGKNIPNEYIERLKKELTVINKMGFNDYFLIVFDYKFIWFLFWYCISFRVTYLICISLFVIFFGV